MTLNNINLRIQKKRTNMDYKKYKLRYGNSAIFMTKESRIEVIYLIFLKKIIKYLLREVRRFKNKPKIWIYWRLNYILTKKSKNSRMGKGKGAYIRKVLRVKAGWPLIEFYGLPYSITRIIYEKMIKKCKLNITLYALSYKNVQTIQKPNVVFDFCKKHWTL